MKKSAFKVALVAATVLISLGYTNAQKGLQIGTEVSPQFSYLVNQDDIDSPYYKTSHAFNGAFGISGQWGFTENIGIGLNVLYSYQGDKYQWKDIERYKLLQYVKIPLMLTVSAPIADKLMFVGKIGPQINFLTDAKLLDSDRNTIMKHGKYKTAWEDVDASAMLSAGVGYMVAERLSLDFALRYDVGFTDAEAKNPAFQANIHDPFDAVTPSPAFSPRGITHNMTLGLTVGLRYNFM